jgi:hypothetical protein
MCTLSCPAGQLACSGSCVFAATDPNHCGACGQACPSRTNASPVCTAATCGILCNPGAANCNANDADGCEVLTGSNVSHCGRCNNACPVRANAAAVCTVGACGVACNGGFGNCNANDADGCEVNFNTDSANCGACGRACTSGQSCQAGTCVGSLATFSGVRNNVAISSLTGWTQCHVETYSTSGAALVSRVQSACQRRLLMVGCRATGSGTLQVVAYAPQSDVLFNTGNGNVTHDANGVGWYYGTSYSWGYVSAGMSVSRSSCDTSGGASRVCFHTSASGGYRCGDTSSLNGSTAYERIFFTAD